MWIELRIPVPPKLAKLCGYPGGARHVGFCWQPCGDECEFNDGRTSGTGSRGPYLAYTRHRAVAPALAPFDLGSGDSHPRHLLIIDGEERKAVAADVRTGREFLRRQPHPPLPEMPAGEAVGSFADFLDLDGWQEVTLGQEAVEARMRHDAEKMDEMLRFLDNFRASPD